jgi:Tol biopolymer transport system component
MGSRKLTRAAFVTPIIAASCALALANQASGQPSAAAPAWGIGKIVLQADDEWFITVPLQMDAHTRGSGSVVQKRMADDIVVADSPDSEQRRVGIGLEPAISPDGHSVVYCGMTRLNQSDRQLIEVEIDTGKRTELTHLKIAACDAAWSPDGSKIAFNTESSKGAVVAVLDLANSYILAISPGARPQWSPDGKRLVFLRWPELASGPDSIWIVNADGSGLRKVSDTRALLPSANWGADGSSIIFTRDNNHRTAIFRVDLDGNNLQEIAGDKNIDMYFPSISPDGRELTVIADSVKSPKLMLINLDTHKSRVLCKALRASVLWVKNH